MALGRKAYLGKGRSYLRITRVNKPKTTEQKREKEGEGKTEKKISPKKRPITLKNLE